MQEDPLAIGLVSYGIYLPKTFETAAEVADRSGLSLEQVRELGIEKKCRPEKEDQPVIMAVKASLQAIEKSPKLSPQDIDVVLWTGEEYKDYIAQTASIRVQEEIGARNAWAFDLVNQGVTSLIGLRVARDLMVGDPSINLVLLAGGTRNVDLVNYKNPFTRWMLPVSASGAALLLRRGHLENRLLGMSFRVDPDMADEVYVPGGGTVFPFNLENLDTDRMYFQVFHPEILEPYLFHQLPERLAEVIKQTMADGGLAEQKPDYLALRHLQPRQQTQTLRALSLEDRFADPLFDVGHHGPNDVIISLDRGLRQGLIKPGHRIILASAGIGFTFAAALIQWGST
jgi:3-oxoacyl-[acyl-carrier-protein] synthase III